MEDIIKFIKKNKKYATEPKIKFINKSYQNELPIKDKVDLLYSQYGGPISQYCKKYLKKDGILLVNNSHANAGIAFLDMDFELIVAVNNRDKKVSISEKNINDYFVPKKAM